MLRSYLKIAVRNLARRKVFSSINIFGLAVGMACTILILLWVQDELSFDAFHRNADKTYLVVRGDAAGLKGVTSRLLAPALKEEFPEVTNAASFMPIPESFGCVVQYGDKAFEENISLADSQFFRMFSFPFLEGDPATALSEPGSIVITEEIERKYFGEDKAAGKLLSVAAFGQHFTMKVTGVLKQIPDNSSIRRKLFLPISWLESLGIKDYGWQNQSYMTYVELSRAVRGAGDIQELSSRIKACELRHDPNEPATLNYSLIPLTDVHLYGSGIKFLPATGDIKYVRIFVAVAVIILLIAGVNYINLSTALSLKRSAEVGIRKTVGATRASLMLQFLGESLVLSVIALAFALLLAELLLPWFNHLSGKSLAIRWADPSFAGIALLVTFFTGAIAGSYPALFLSSFSPVHMLKGKLKLGPNNLFARKGLVVFQFALSTIIIVCTTVVFSQLSFITESNLGFDKENILCIHITGDANSRYEVLRNELKKNPDILGISRSEALNTGSLGSTLGVGWPGKPANEESHFWVLHCDPDMASTYRFEMREGRFYSDQFPADAVSSYVINEAAAKAMGRESPLNQEMNLWGRKGKIIGVTKDFHFASFHSAIEPLIFRIPDKNEAAPRFTIVSLRLRAGEPDNALAFLEKVWGEQMQGIPLNSYFFDDALNAQYGAERRMSSIFKSFSVLSILIACLGLFGLTSISAQQRTKEFGIRKVLGASPSGLAAILSKEFLLWVVMSNVIAVPVAWYAMDGWLQGFAYRIEIGWWMFALAGGMALLIAFLTVSTQAIKAALANPVEALRYE